MGSFEIGTFDCAALPAVAINLFCLQRRRRRLPREDDDFYNFPEVAATLLPMNDVRGCGRFLGLDFGGDWVGSDTPYRAARGLILRPNEI